MGTDLVRALEAVRVTKVCLAHSLVLAFPSSQSAMAPTGSYVVIGASRTLLKASNQSSLTRQKGALRRPSLCIDAVQVRAACACDKSRTRPS